MSLKINLKRPVGRCVGKVRYRRQETADNACTKMAEKGSDGLSSYFCPRCGGFHIGHELRIDRLIEQVRQQLISHSIEVDVTEE